MSRIRGKDTAPELALRRALWANGFRYRVHTRLPGRPDICVGSLRFAIFVDGCFWHGCQIHGVKPRSNRLFWANKLRKNQQRDRAADKALRDLGWTVFRIWEHEVENELDSVVARIAKARTLSLKQARDHA
jgi:DNA mismatch endonuclease, patch repair protein